MKPTGLNTIIRGLMLVLLTVSLAACATAPSGKGKKPVRASANDEAESAHMSLSALEAAYKQNSDNPTIALNYAKSLRDKGRLQRAGMVLDPFIQNRAQNTPAMLSEYSALQAARGNNMDAELYARKAIAMDSKNGEAYHVLGIALDAQGKHEQAETAFRKALDNWQGNPSPVLNNLGLNLAAQGFLDEAVSTLRRAVKQSPDNTEIERNLRIVTALQAQTPPQKTPPAPSSKPGVKKKRS